MAIRRRSNLEAFTVKVGFQCLIKLSNNRVTLVETKGLVAC